MSIITSKRCDLSSVLSNFTMAYCHVELLDGACYKKFGKGTCTTISIAFILPRVCKINTSWYRFGEINSLTEKERKSVER